MGWGWSQNSQADNLKNKDDVTVKGKFISAKNDQNNTVVVSKKDEVTQTPIKESDCKQNDTESIHSSRSVISFINT